MSKTRGKHSQIQPKQAQQKTPQRSLSGHAARVDLAIWLALIVSVFIVYAQVGHFDFVDYDDGDYVYQNSHIPQGLTAGNIRWALSAVVASNWMPVTLLSHMLDVQLFGVQNSGMHHWVNVLFHALSAVLLFVVFRRATGARAPSAFVAFLFALHPLHVESVAWIAERKDVLSGFFFFLALYCYVRYTERPGPGRYALVAGVFCLGLMSKPMLVTFPFTLLLFDLWPLRRWRWPNVIWEKLPLAALSAGDAVVTYLTQQSAGAVGKIALSARIGNALVSYVTYAVQTLWPARLAVFYPFLGPVALWKAAASLVVLLAATGLAVRAWRTRPYLTVGWLWYLGTLVPVIGVVQAGAQAHADRYMYIPMTGLSVMLAWGVVDAIRKWPRAKNAIAAMALGVLAVSMALARTQTDYWRNSETLFRHALDVTENNWVADGNLGNYLTSTGTRAAEAVPYFKDALRIVPWDANVDNELGACLIICKREAEAIPYLAAAVRLRPGFGDAHYNFGMALSHTGRVSEAMAEYESALRLWPDNDLAHNNLGLLLLRQGRTREALAHFEAAVRLHPDYGCERNLGDTLAMIPGRESEAIAHLEAAQRFNPDPEIARTISRLQAARK